MTPSALADALRSHTAADRFASADGGAIAVDLDAGEPPPPDLAALLASQPFLVVGLHRSSTVEDPNGTVDRWWLEAVDVVVDPGPGVDAIDAVTAASPIAATTLALLLRGGDGRTVGEGLVAESAAYSTAQGGAEFARWRAGRPPRRRRDEDEPRVRVERAGDDLTVTLTRPAARNALDSRLRDELCEALLVAAVDPTVERIELRGEGPDFCAGGDLDEFGDRTNIAAAHLIRLHRSPARLLAALAPRTTAHLHGACMGSGIELPAFVARVVAAPDTRIALPEIGLGLVPGAGGTVSLPARIGRHRTAWLALTGRTIDAPTALAWGLVDAVDG